MGWIFIANSREVRGGAETYRQLDTAHEPHDRGTVRQLPKAKPVNGKNQGKRNLGSGSLVRVWAPGATTFTPGPANRRALVTSTRSQQIAATDARTRVARSRDHDRHTAPLGADASFPMRRKSSARRWPYAARAPNNLQMCNAQNQRAGNRPSAGVYTTKQM